MKTLTLLLLIFTTTLAFSQTIDCKKFKDGKFKIVDPEIGNTYIERKGSKQVEYGQLSQMKLQFKVKWIDECTYTLKLKKVIENPNDYQTMKGLVLTVEIIETKANSYVQKSTMELLDIVYVSEMIKVD